MAQAYCNNCDEVMPLNCHIKKAICSCGSTGLVVVCGRWNDKCGFDYFDRSGMFLKFVPHIPYVDNRGTIESAEVKQPIKQLGLF